MLDRKKTILTAAYDVFSRYGMKRATMNDIAAEAGVARQTLYNAFENKEAILRGIIALHIDETQAAIEDCASGEDGLEAAIELIFDHVARKPYQLLNNTPHGNEILEGITHSAKELLSEGYQRMSVSAAKVFSLHMHQNAEPGAKEMGEFLVYATMSMKHKAESAEQLDRLLSITKQIVMKSVS